MPFNTLIQRSDVNARIPQNVSDAMLTSLTATSAALELGTRIPLPAGTNRFPVLSALPSAYWVTGDTGMKETSTAAWADKTINVEEVAVIVPVPENVLDDAGFDVWGAVRPLMESAIARVIDQAVFLGINKPVSFPADLSSGAAAAGNSVVRGTNTVANGGVVADIADLVGLLEDDGYFPANGIARPGLRGVIRRLSAQTEANRPGEGVSATDWYGANMSYPLRGLWPTAVSTVEAIIGDFSNLVVGIRKDFTYKLITEGVITNGATPPVIQFNLPQQDMVALRVTFRMGFQVANPINYDQPTEAARYPFARLVRPAA